VVVVTHHLDEVREHADEVSVMRQGRLVSTRKVEARDEASLQSIMHDIMGRAPPGPMKVAPRTPGEVALEVRDLGLGQALHGVTLKVRAGEVVGIAGVEGNGQRELVRVLAGLQAPDAGDVKAGAVAVVHEDRHAEGLVLGASVRDNLMLGELGRYASRLGIIDAGALEQEAQARLERARVTPEDLDVLAGTLSGGNQQKVVVARAAARHARVKAMVFAQPTRGVDILAARAIHAEILRMAFEGLAVVVVSADLGELRSLSDRILVMARGRIAGEFPPDATDAQLGEAMLGGAKEPGQASA
jgi:ABC-type uncharacterized transport system ATPase subunit